MGIRTVHVRAASKRAINRDLEQGLPVWGKEYVMYSETDVRLDEYLQDGTVIKIFKKVISGSPYVHAYGNWDSKKLRVK